MRDYNDPEYKKWRLAVYRRDKFKCKKCGSRRRLQAHHIKSWAKFPQLRLSLLNGITLCNACHKLMWGNEEAFEGMCNTLLSKPSVIVDILLRMRAMDDEV